MNADRRVFLKGALKGAMITALSRSRILGANDRVRLGGIGVGGRGNFILGLGAKAENTQVVAVSDVYQPRLAEVRDTLAPGGDGYKDYRQLLDRKDIDAVFIGSPDHWHVRMILDAVSAGKDVYCEKPVTHSIEEGEKLLAATADTKQVIQIGYQQRSWEHYKAAGVIVKSGKLGDMPLILTSWYQGYRRMAMRTADPQKIDWKGFLGSAPDQPFDALRCARWRWFWDFGGGHLTDLFSHWVDVIHWHMGESAPRSVEAMGTRKAFPEFECPDTLNAAYEYPGGFMVVHTGSLSGSLEAGNIVYRGSQGMMRLNRSGYSVWMEGPETFEKPVLPPPADSLQSAHDGTIDHVQNFLDCVRSRNPPNAPLASSVAAARAAHLGNLAYRQGSRITA